MKTLLAYCLLLVFAVFVLVSCGGGGGGGVTTSSKVKLSNFELGGLVNGVGVSESGSVFNGLDGTLVLTDPTAGDITVSEDGLFDFGSILANSTDYDVTVKTHPAGQECRVTNGSGTVDGLDISNIEVLCAPRTSDLERFAEKFINSMAGDEISGTFSGTLSGADYTFDLNGISFCSPAAPFADPVIPATPPNNIYGCINNANLTATINNPTADTAVIQVSADALYIDFSLVRGAFVLCPVPASSEGYIELGGVELDVSLGLINSPEGFKYAKTISVGSSLGSTSDDIGLSGDSCLSTYIDMLSSAVNSEVFTVLEGGLDFFVTDTLMPTMPIFSNTP